MSNMIKAYSVRYDAVITKTIDTHLRLNQEVEVKRSQLPKTIETNNDFVEGLTAVVIDTFPDSEEITERSLKILEDAENEAKRILEEAQRNAEQMKKDAVVAAQKKGYDNGMLQAKHEALKFKEEYEEKVEAHQKEYEAMIQEIEPKMASIIASLVEKMTGIIVKDKEEVILYLVSNALKNMDKSDEYTIRVSKEDFEFITARKDLLLSAIGREVSLYIEEDSELKEKQCLIEADLRVINCSLDVQMNNLIMDLKLIAGI